MGMITSESRVLLPALGRLVGLVLVSWCTLAEDKAAVLARPGSAAAPVEVSKLKGGGGYRTAVTNGVVVVPVVVVGGTPYQMGWHFGRLMKSEINAFVPPVVAGFKKELGVGDAELDEVWAATAGYTDDRVEQEILGVAQGAGLPVRMLQHAHCLPLLMPYSCSSIAAWGSATADGHLYQTRNLDWSLIDEVVLNHGTDDRCSSLGTQS